MVCKGSNWNREVGIIVIRVVGVHYIYTAKNIRHGIVVGLGFSKNLARKKNGNSIDSFIHSVKWP